jgi:hypothetical protein
MRAKLVIKYLFLFIVHFFLCTKYSQGQAYLKQDNLFYGGIVAGVNYTQVDGDNFAGYRKVGLNTGLYVAAKLGEHIHSSLELLYSQRGARAGGNQLPKLANDQSTVLTGYRIWLDYIEIPIIFNYSDAKFNQFGLGASYGQLFRSKETYRDQNGKVYEQDAKLYPFRKSDVNIIANATGRVWKGLFFNMRLQYSVFSIRNAHNYITGRAQQFNNIVNTRLIYLL